MKNKKSILADSTRIFPTTIIVPTIKIGNSSVESWIQSWIQREYLLTRLSLYNSFITSNVIHHSYIHPFKHSVTLFVDNRVCLAKAPEEELLLVLLLTLKNGIPLRRGYQEFAFPTSAQNFYPTVRESSRLRPCAVAITSGSSRAIVVDASATTSPPCSIVISVHERADENRDRPIRSSSIASCV